MNRTDKSAVIDRLREELADVPAVIVADFRGLTVEQTDQLRSAFRKAQVSYEVVKNTLVRMATAGTSKESLHALFKGNTAIAYHSDDPAAPARIIRDFAKDNDRLAVKGGWLGGKVLNADGVKALADMPGKDELRGGLLSVLVGGPSKFVRTLAAGPTQFLLVLRARQQHLEG